MSLNNDDFALSPDDEVSLNLLDVFSLNRNLLIII